MSFDIPIHVGELTGQILKRTRMFEGPGGIKFFLGISNGNEFVHVEGSFHKFKNQGEQNFDDFFLSEIPDIVRAICKIFGISIETKINNLAFGVNLVIPFDPEIYIRQFIMYKGTPFNPMTINKGSGITCIKDQFIIKIYNKGRQYKLPAYILRIEIKVVKMQFFASNSVNINSLKDLLDINNLLPLVDILPRYFNDCLICDPSINSRKLSAKDRELLANGKRASYWSEMRKPGTQDYRKQRKKYEREMKKFKSIVSSLNGDKLHTIVTDLLSQKLNEFRSEVEQKKGANLPTCMSNNIEEQGANSPFNYTVEMPQSLHQRNCLVCGGDISSKKLSARFCSKKCKNTFTNPILNPRNNLLRKIERRCTPGLLFPCGEGIVLSPEQQHLINRPNSIYHSV